MGNGEHRLPHGFHAINDFQWLATLNSRPEDIHKTFVNVWPLEIIHMEAIPFTPNVSKVSTNCMQCTTYKRAKLLFEDTRMLDV